MASYNKVILMGHLVRDPELRATGGGVNVGSFSLAINNRSKDDKDSVSYVDCVAFDKQADFAKEHLTKGQSIHVEGRLQQNRWEQEGQKRSKIVVIVERLTFVGASKNGENTPPEAIGALESDFAD